MKNKNFGQKLKELRKISQKTQKEIADILEISPTCYAGYEQGYREPDLETLKKICILFEVDANELIGISEEKDFKINLFQYTQKGNINNFIRGNK